MRILYVAFKGNGNASNRIVSNLTGDKLFLTNSYGGLKKDIDSIENAYDLVYMFGLDKNLKGEIRIDSVAEKDNARLCSHAGLDAIAARLNQGGISTNVGYTPAKYLCNEAFWHMLKKYNNQAVFFHVPSIRFIDEDFIKKIVTIFQEP